MKKLIALLLTGLMLISLAACGNNAGSPTAQGTNLQEQNNETLLTNAENNGKVKDSITIAFPSATSLTPWGTTNATPGNYEVYESLFEVTGNGEVFAVLADETRGTFGGYDHEAGTGVYTVYIYDSIYDHKGNHVTADDVVFSFTHQFEKETTSGWGDFISAEKVDDTTVKFTFTEDQSGIGEFENFFCRCFIVDEDTYKGSLSGLLSEMIGTGPYKMASYTSGSKLILEAYDNYWQKDETHRHQAQMANVKTITYLFVDEAATKILDLKAGTVDLADDITTINAADFIDGAQYGDKYNVYTYMTKEICSLWLNCSPESRCGDVNMRKAIYYAIDLEGLIMVMGGTDMRGYSWASSYYSDYNADWEKMDNYNTYAGTQEERQKLVADYLAKAGYKGEDIVFVYQADQSDVASIVINMCAAYGIKVSARGTDHAGATSIEADPTQWDMEMGKWAGDYNAQAWLHAYDWACTAEGTHTVNYVYDKEWQDLLQLCQTQEGHTPENMT